MYNKDSTLSNPQDILKARQNALQMLYAIEVEQAYTDVVLRRELQESQLDRRDRAFITECVYGTVRWQGRIDWLLSQACHRPLSSLTPWIRNALRLGVYQCLWMDRVPQRAAVHTTVELARHFGHRGVSGFVNGVLRTILRNYRTYTLPNEHEDPAAYLAILTSHPQWLVERWLQRYGQERTAALCQANNRVTGITLRTNTLRTTPEALAQRLRAEGLTQVIPSQVSAIGLCVQGTSRLDSLLSYQQGLFQVQDEGAMLVAPFGHARPQQQWLDACAAPGGKTTYLAQLMEGQGHIVACDIQRGRLRLLQANIRRLGFTNVSVVTADASQGIPFNRTFDGILVDAPCSGFGVLRRHPDIKWRKTAQDFQALQATQLALLHMLQQSLMPAGVLLYSVCSNEPEETHEVVKAFLAHHPSIRLESLDSEFPKQPLYPSPTAGTLDLTPEQWGTEGVFVARFRRQSLQQ